LVGATSSSSIMRVTSFTLMPDSVPRRITVSSISTRESFTGANENVAVPVRSPAEITMLGTVMAA